jgi:hypothetical protein
MAFLREATRLVEANRRSSRIDPGPFDMLEAEEAYGALNGAAASGEIVVSVDWGRIRTTLIPVITLSGRNNVRDWRAHHHDYPALWRMINIEISAKSANSMPDGFERNGPQCPRLID